MRPLRSSPAARADMWMTLRCIATVFRKEVVDALRDRRTLATVLISAVLLGPLVLIAISALVTSLEEHAEQREVYVAGIEHAPTLRNYLERQSVLIRAAPLDYATQLRAARLSDPVVVIPSDFETALLQGRSPRLEVTGYSANPRARAAIGRVMQLLAGFNRERATLGLALRGISVELLEPVRVDPVDLAGKQTRAMQLTGVLPFFVLMAVLYGALTAALDTTAGERERGSLEPLLMNPTQRWALVVGKWGAVACIGMLIALLSSLSFLSGQWVLRSDTLAAMFQYGLREALLFLVVLLPFAAALAALLMAVAIRSRSFKEAQATSTLVVLGVSLLPLVSIFNLGSEAPWHLWVPALAQNALMTRVLKGEGFSALQFLVPLVVCIAITVAANAWVARALRGAALK